MSKTNKYEEIIKQSLQCSDGQFEPFGFSNLIGISLSTLNEGKIVYVNQGFLKLMGYNQEELIGRTGYELEHWPSNEARSHFVEKLKKHKLIDNVEHIYKQKDGKRFYGMVSYELVDVEETPCVLSLHFNIMQAKWTGEIYNNLFENSIPGLVIIQNDEIIYINNSAAKIAGYPIAEISLLQTEEFIGMVFEDEREDLLDKIAKVQDGRLGFTQSSLRIYCKDGSIRWLDVDISRISFQDQDAVQCIIVDSTEQHLAHQQIISISNRLAKVEEIERRQLAEVLHDRIGENLTALSIALNVAKNQLSTHTAEELKARLDDCLELVRQTGERTRSLMYDLHPLALEEDGIIAALQIYSAHIAYRSNIHIDIQPEELIFRFPETIEIALFRIAQEALNNVVKHANARQVFIRFRVEPEKIYMLIKDDGDGFNPNVLKKLAKQSHWGILSMQERAEAVGGQLKVESKIGSGTSITVEVPF